MSVTRAAAALAVALAAVLHAAAQQPDLDAEIRGVLTRFLKFSAGDLADLQRGRIVKHDLDARAPGEFGVAGAARIRGSRAAFLAAARDIVGFKKDAGVLQIGRLSDPPTLGDLDGLTVDRDDFDASSCRLNDCGIRLPADLIRRVPQEIDLKAPDVQAQAAAWFKKVLLADVTAYLSGGPTRFVQYDDGPEPIRPIDELEGILEHTPALAVVAPGLPDHLRAFPAHRVAGAEDFLYWSKEKFGVAPFITVTHVTIVCTSDRTCVMATKDVYSSRYINASLALAIAGDAVGQTDTFYLVYANRTRANALKGGMSGLRKMLVERRARGALEESLKNIRTRLETRR
jgi:hypothetical protein